MTSVDAPEPSLVEALADQSISSMTVSGIYADFYNRASTLIAHLQVKNPASSFAKALKRTGAFDIGYRDVLVRDWHRISSPNEKVANPTTLPGGTTWRARWSPDSQYLAVGLSFSPYLLVYKMTDGVLTSVTLPSPPAGSIYGLTWTPDGRELIAQKGGGAAGYYIWRRDSAGVFSLYGTNSSILSPVLTATGGSVESAPDGMYLGFGTYLEPYHAVYKRSQFLGSTFSIYIKLPDLVVSGTFGNTTEVKFSPDGRYLTVATNKSPYLFNFKREGDVFSRLSNPAPIPSGNAGAGLAWSPTGTHVALTTSTSPYFSVYKRNGDSFVKISDPSVLLPGQGRAIEFSPDGKYLVVGTITSPYMATYRLEANDSLTLLDLPSNPPGGTVHEFQFSPDGKYLAAAHETSPFVSVYKSAMGPVPGAAVRINPDVPVIG